MARAVEMFDLKNYQGVIDQLRQIDHMYLSHHDACDASYYHAMALMYRGDLLKARDAFAAILAEQPASPWYLAAKLGYADTYFYEGDYTGAMEIYRAISVSALNLDQADGLRYRQAYCLLMTKDYDRALAAFDDIASSASPYASAAKFYKGYILYTQGEYAAAKDILMQVDTSKAPGNQACYYLTQIEFAQEHFRQALDMARKAIPVVDPESRPEMERIAGESLYRLGDTDAALPYLRRYASSVSEPLPSTLYILGVCDYDTGNLDEAVRMLTPVTALSDAMGQSAYLYIGQAALSQGNMDAALLALEQAYRMDYDADVQETAFYNYAVARSQGGRTPFGSSVSLFEDFLKRFPNSRFAPAVQEYLITGYMTDNNYEKALQSIERITHPSAAVLTAKQRVLYILGTRDLAANRTSQALTRFEQSRQLASHNRAMATECDLWIGDCYYRLGKYPQAVKSLNSYLKSAPYNSVNIPLAYYDLGYARFAEKKYGDARADFQKVIRQPGNLSKTVVADAYNRIGDCYYYASSFKQAEENYDQAFELAPQTGDYALFQKAVMLGLVNDHSGEIRLLDDMMSRYSTSALMPSALLEKAESQLAANTADQAIATYRKLVKSYPATAQGRNGALQLAITLLSGGRKNEAIDIYKKVITDYPTSDEARVATDDLKQIYADDGRLRDFSAFIASVPNAPRLEISEIDALTFQSAEKAYLADGSLTRLDEYVAQFPSGQYAPQALGYLAAARFESGDNNAALRYATALVDRFPHSEAAEEALAIKGDIELQQGDPEAAIATFRTLEQRASVARNILAARMGIMRVSRDLGNHADVIAAADRILASSSVPSEFKSETIYARAYALAQSGHGDEAVNAWKQLAGDTDDLYGAKSAYYLGQHYFDSAQYAQAKKTVEKLIDSNTPHQYWLARGYILLSDILRAQGSTFEADEYLKSLRENYPGTEGDIFTMIDSRLEKK